MIFRQVYTYLLRISIVLLCSFMVFSCATKKKKGEVSKFGKFYHNLNSEYNGYFNANELIKESTAILRENSIDNYSNLLDVYDYVAVTDPKMVYGQLDKAIEKVTRVAAIHEAGDWVDDCYVLMGEAQFLKQDYESSVETFEFFQDEFNPANPFGRNYKKRKVSRSNNKAAAKERKKELEAERKEKDDLRKDAKEAQDKQRKLDQEAKEQARKDLQKQKEDEQKAKKKAAEDRKKEAEERRKARANGKRVPKSETPTTSPPAEVKKDPEVKTPVKTPSKDTVAQEKPIAENEPPKDKQKEKADKSAYNEGLLWLAKAYTRTEQYANAEYLLNRIDELSDHKKEVKVGWAPAMADLKIKQKEYNGAVKYLEMAYESADRKEDKARYAFIAGQILGLNGRYAEASSFFEKAKKKAGKNFKLKFMAQLNQLKNNALDGNKGIKDVERELEKMLKEDKNKDYKDQIYFALGEIEFNRNETAKALDYFSLSIQNNGNDPILKAESYYKMAGMYYGSKNYVEAKAYYDSTAMNMAVKDPRGIAVADMSRKLKDVAESLSTIIKLDSLLAISELDKDALMEIAKERKKKNEAGTGAKIDPATSSPLYTSKRTVSLNSSFFAYNPINLENGKKEFVKTWGEIPLEDNWRRSKKSLSAGSGPISYDETQAVEQSTKIDDEEFKKLMADIPFEQTQKIRYNNQISEALYKLGSKLKLDLEDYEESNKYLERLVAQYPNDNRRIEALYLLYTNYTEQNDVSNAARIKKIILESYPESNYAKIIKDPSFVDELISESMRVETYYDDTYKMFEDRNYTVVIERASNAGNLFGTDNKFMARFSLISAMSLGFLEGKESYIKGLQETIVRYPGTPEETKAKEVMRFLKGDESSFNTVNVQEVDNIFTKEDDSRHYVAVVLFDYSDKAMQAAKISILNYNKEYFSLDNLQLGDQILSKDEGTQIIMIRSFENMSKARKYYDTVTKDQEKFISSTIAAYELLPITQRNFRKMIAEKSHASYRAFFEANYK